MGVHMVPEAECDRPGCDETLTGHKADTPESIATAAAAEGWMVRREPLKHTVTICPACTSKATP